MEMIKIKSIIADPSNARKHSGKNLDAIKGSLAKFGQQKPIVVSSDNIVIAGNGTLEAAKALGWNEIGIFRSKLTGVEATAYAIADNRAGELAEWDDNILSKTLAALKADDFDLNAIGFDDKDLLNWLKEPEIIPGCDADEIPEQVETRCKLGDLWLLGEHKLLCGDSTDVLQVERLMGSQKADMVFTDPPYGVSYQSNMRKKSDRFDVIKNDDKILTEWINVLPIVSNGWVFIWTSWKVLNIWLDVTNGMGALTNLVVWDKGGGGIGDLTGSFSSDYELALVFNRGSKLTGKRIGSVWDIGKDKAKDYVHPTQKPVDLAIMAFEACTRSKDKILDLFLGSGSTLIACEKTKRKCYGMELDTHYCDVIIARWEKFSGKTATLAAEQV